MPEWGNTNSGAATNKQTFVGGAGETRAAGKLVEYIDGQIVKPFPAFSGEMSSWTNTGITSPAAAVDQPNIEIVGDTIYLFGGAGSTAIWSAPVSDPTNWTDTGATIPEIVTGGSVKTIGSTIYLFGGADSNKILSASTSAPTVWSDTGQTLPGTLHNSHCEIIGSNVYLLGGQTASAGGYSTATDVVWAATTAAPTVWSDTGWSISRNLTHGVSVVGDDGYVYVIGGHNGTGYENAIVRASTGSLSSWSLAGTFPTITSRTSLIVAGDYAFILGGYTGSYDRSIYRANMSDPSIWSDYGIDTPQNQIDHGSYLVGADIYLAGGEPAGTIITATLELDGVAWGVLASDTTLGSDAEVYTCDAADCFTGLTPNMLYYYDLTTDALTTNDTGYFIGLAISETQIALGVADIDFLTGDIRSIQTGSTSSTISINKVNPKKATINSWSNSYAGTNDGIPHDWGYYNVTTKVAHATISQDGKSVQAHNGSCRFEVIEYK